MPDGNEVVFRGETKPHRLPQRWFYAVVLTTAMGLSLVFGEGNSAPEAIAAVIIWGGVLALLLLGWPERVTLTRHPSGTGMLQVGRQHISPARIQRMQPADIEPWTGVFSATFWLAVLRVPVPSNVVVSLGETKGLRLDLEHGGSLTIGFGAASEGVRLALEAMQAAAGEKARKADDALFDHIAHLGNDEGA